MGTSLSAGHVYVLRAIDRRVKAVVGQVPFISGSRHIGDLLPADTREATFASFAADRRARARGDEAAYLPIADQNPCAGAALPTPDSYQYFFGPGGVAERDPSFANRITARSVENCFGYEPGWYLSHITATPVLMVIATRDRLTAGELALAAYENAFGPKRLVTIDCGHFEAYFGPSSNIAKSAARTSSPSTCAPRRPIESVRASSILLRADATTSGKPTTILVKEIRRPDWK